MKNAVFCLLCLLSLSFFVGCGDMEENETPTTTAVTGQTATAVTGQTAKPDGDFLVNYWTGETYHPSKRVQADPQKVEEFRLRAESIREQLWEGQIEVPPDWDKTEDKLLRAEYARFLLRKGIIEIPPNWQLTKDRALQDEYRRAQLIKQFGDIPEVHTYVDTGKFVSLAGATVMPREERIAFLEANYKLFPTEANRLTLERAKLVPDRILGGPSLEKIRKESPELWARHKHAQHILKHGHTPQVQIVADFTRKVELELPRTDAECRAFLDALDHIMPIIDGQRLDEAYLRLEAQLQLGINPTEVRQRALQMFRKARAEGIPFRLINWDELDFD